MLFDFDGTLTRPDALDFPAIKREVGCPPDSLVLEWIEALADRRAAREGAGHARDASSWRGAAESEPNEGAERVVRSLRAQASRSASSRGTACAAVRAASRGFPTSPPATST